MRPYHALVVPMLLWCVVFLVNSQDFIHRQMKHLGIRLSKDELLKTWEAPLTNMSTYAMKEATIPEGL